MERSQQSTRNRGKAIVTSSAPTYDPEPDTVTEDDEMSKDKEIEKLMALISLSYSGCAEDDTDNESEDHELEAHYMYMAQLQEVTPDQVDNSGPIFNDDPIHKSQGGADDTDDLDQERDLLAL
ncbi:hypothetical protein Tco_0801888 [Tanacetum coccineum]|uniref:Uncharacterized protein n=1 Tax=Tanacetum coccineum TaxID=301880 RepID=A0ABQ4ZX87_9ASTR